jgi:hypothetical protein
MAFVADYLAIDNFEQIYKQDSKKFTSSEYLRIPDSNNTNYSAGKIKFDTLAAKDQFVVYANSYLRMTLAIKSATAGATAQFLESDKIAWKNSILDLISSVQISTASGSSIINDNSVQYLNTIRRLVETSIDSMDTNMQEFEFYKNTSLPASAASAGGIAQGNNTNVGLNNWFTSNPILAGNDPQEFIQTNRAINGIITAIPPGTAFNGVTDGTVIVNVNELVKNSAYNRGFDRRVKAFKENSTFTTTGSDETLVNTFTTTVDIPLSMLSSFFKALDFPIINARFQIVFGTPVTNSSTAIINDCPIMHATYNSALTPVAMSDAAISIMGTCQLVYQRVTYSPQDNARVASLVNSGHRMVISIPIGDYYSSLSSGKNAVPNGNTITDLVSPNTVLPTRVWQMFLKQGYTSGQLNFPAPPNTPSIQTVPFVSNGGPVYANVLINNQNYYLNDIDSTHEFWHIFQEALVSYGFIDNLGAGLSYEDYLQNYRIQLFDVSRIGNRLVNAADPCSIQVRYRTPGAPGSVTYPDGNNVTDVLYLVEREIIVELLFAQGVVNVSVGSSSGGS